MAPKSNRLEGERGRYLYLFAALKEKEKGPVFCAHSRKIDWSVCIHRAGGRLRRVLTTSWIKIIGYKLLYRDSINIISYSMDMC